MGLTRPGERSAASAAFAAGAAASASDSDVGTVAASSSPRARADSSSSSSSRSASSPASSSSSALFVSSMAASMLASVPPRLASSMKKRRQAESALDASAAAFSSSPSPSASPAPPHEHPTSSPLSVATPPIAQNKKPRASSALPLISLNHSSASSALSAGAAASAAASAVAPALSSRRPSARVATPVILLATDLDAAASPATASSPAVSASAKKEKAKLAEPDAAAAPAVTARTSERQRRRPTWADDSFVMAAEKSAVQSNSSVSTPSNNDAVAADSPSFSASALSLSASASIGMASIAGAAAADSEAPVAGKRRPHRRKSLDASQGVSASSSIPALAVSTDTYIPPTLSSPAAKAMGKTAFVATLVVESDAERLLARSRSASLSSDPLSISSPSKLLAGFTASASHRAVMASVVLSESDMSADDLGAEFDMGADDSDGSSSDASSVHESALLLPALDLLAGSGGNDLLLVPSSVFDHQDAAHGFDMAASETASVSSSSSSSADLDLNSATSAYLSSTSASLSSTSSSSASSASSGMSFFSVPTANASSSGAFIGKSPVSRSSRADSFASSHAVDSSSAMSDSLIIPSSSTAAAATLSLGFLQSGACTPLQTLSQFDGPSSSFQGHAAHHSHSLSHSHATHHSGAHMHLANGVSGGVSDGGGGVNGPAVFEQAGTLMMTPERLHMQLSSALTSSLLSAQPPTYARPPAHFFDAAASMRGGLHSVGSRSCGVSMPCSPTLTALTGRGLLRSA